MQHSKTRVVLRRALSRLEQSPEALREYKALGRLLRGINRSRDMGPSQLLAAFRAFTLGGLGIARGLLRMSAQTWVDLGVALTNRGLHVSAVLAYDAALSVDPDCAEAWFDKAIVLTRRQRYGQALVAYRKAQSLEPHDPEIAYNIGGILARLRRYEEALVVYDDLIRTARLDVGPALGDGLLESSERRPPARAEVWFNRGVVLEALDRIEEAIAAYDQAVRLQPWFTKANARRKRLQESWTTASAQRPRSVPEDSIA